MTNRILRGVLACFLVAVGVAGCTPEEEAADGPGKRVALTFDDVPRGQGAWLGHDERARMLIDALDEAGVEQAAFFVNPASLSDPDRPGGEERIAAYVEAGHVIANHSNTHPALQATPADVYLADIDAAGGWLEGRPGYRPWFRYPYLDEGGRDMEKRDAVRRGLEERGLKTGYVTINASDWFFEQAAKDAVAADRDFDREALGELYVRAHVEAAEFYDDLARRAIGRSPAHVMLLHETDLAAFFIDDLVEALRDEGWTIISADEAFEDPIGELRPDVPFAQGTVFEALAWEKDLPEPRWFPGNNTERLGEEFEAWLTAGE